MCRPVVAHSVTVKMRKNTRLKTALTLEKASSTTLRITCGMVRVKREGLITRG